MGVAAVCRDVVVILAAQREGADGDRFLANVEMKEAADFSALIVLQADLLEAANANHLSQELDLAFCAKFLIDRDL